MATFPRELDKLENDENISRADAIRSAYLLGRRSLLGPVQARIDGAVLTTEARRELIQVRDKILARSQNRTRIRAAS